MSHRLEYQWTAFHVPAASLGMTDDRFVIAIEGGDNNVCDARTGKRSRSWNVGMIGSRVQVLRQAVRVAGACEGGNLQPLGRRCTPEAYVRRIRALLDAPMCSAHGHWRARLRVSPAHPVLGELESIGLDFQIEKRNGENEACAEFATAHWLDFFGLIDRYGLDVPPWRWAEVVGLSSS